MNYFDFLNNYVKTQQSTYGDLVSEKNNNQLAKNMMNSSELLEYNKNRNKIIDRINNNLNNNETMKPNNIGTKKYISGINEVTQIM